LSLQPWTTYELAQQMGRALGQFWPRAESKLYEEPKKLVAHGLARASAGTIGRRPRTVYAITAKGRKELSAWMSMPGEGPVLEFEQLIRVFFAEFGSRADLLATIASVRRWTDEQVALAADIAHDYLDGEGRFPERLPWLILTGRLLEEFIHAIGRWAEWAAETVDGWPDDIRSAQPDWATLEAMARHDDAYLREARARRRGGAD
jgi:PadR family transcriptional regulator, regulatory protein AphA